MLDYNKQFYFALDLANKIHKDQVRYNGEPYILHPIRVMLKMETISEKIVALLHDVLEDCEDNGYNKLEIYNLIKENLSNEIVTAILVITRDKEVKYEDYLRDLCASKLTYTVKKADIYDNIYSLEDIEDINERNKRRNKYNRALTLLHKEICLYLKWGKC